jgi:hypothetical protein
MTFDPYDSDKRRIDVDDAYDVELWGLVLGVPRELVLLAVIEVGDDAIQVKGFLDRLKTPSSK